MCEQNPDFRVGRYNCTKQGRNNHLTKVLDLGRPGVYGGARAGIALLPTSEARGLESRSPFWGGGARGGFVSLTQTAPASACPTTRPLEPLGHTEETGKWPDQSGQSRLCRTLSEFAEVGEAIERRSANEDVTTVTTSCMRASSSVSVLFP